MSRDGTAPCLRIQKLILVVASQDILLEKNTDRIKIIDFGMATLCKEGERLSETMGTVAYMVSVVAPVARPQR